MPTVVSAFSWTHCVRLGCSELLCISDKSCFLYLMIFTLLFILLLLLSYQTCFYFNPRVFSPFSLPSPQGRRGKRAAIWLFSHTVTRTQLNPFPTKFTSPRSASPALSCLPAPAGIYCSSHRHPRTRSSSVAHTCILKQHQAQPHLAEFVTGQLFGCQTLLSPAVVYPFAPCSFQRSCSAAQRNP